MKNISQAKAPITVGGYQSVGSFLTQFSLSQLNLRLFIRQPQTWGTSFYYKMNVDGAIS